MATTIQEITPQMDVLIEGEETTLVQITLTQMAMVVVERECQDASSKPLLLLT